MRFSLHLPRRPFTLALAAGLLSGALTPLDAAKVSVTPERRQRWHFEVGPSYWLGTRVRYGATAASEPSLTPKTDRLYDDGYNRVDASGNLGDGNFGPLASRTGFFGFASDSQVDLRAGTLALHQTRAAPGNYLANARPKVGPGLEIAVRRSFARDDDKRDWGFELALDLRRFRAEKAGAEAVNLRMLTDAYPLGGVVPQRAPYAGRFTPAPGDQRIGDTPVRSTSQVSGVVTGRRVLEGRSQLLRFGPWINLTKDTVVPFSDKEGDRWVFLVRGGLGLLRQRLQFVLDEQLQAPGVTGIPVVTASGSRQRTDLVGFAGIKFRRRLDEEWSLLGWADYISGSQLTVSGGERYVRFLTRDTVLVGLAVEYVPAAQSQK